MRDFEYYERRERYRAESMDNAARSRINRRRLTREQRREHKRSVLATVICLAALATVICYAVANGAEQEATQPEMAELTPQQVERITEPLKAEIKPPVRYDITPDELDIVARVVHSEASGEGYDGQALVAQCILNTAEALGKRPDEVVLAPKQYAAPAAEASEEVKAAVAAVFLGGYQVTTEPVRYFYSPAGMENGVSEWHENSLEYVLTWGGHKFFTE